VNSRGAFRVIARNAPFFAPGGGVLNHEWTRINVAGAFQPEICSAAAGVPGDCGCGASALQAVGLTRSREVAKGNAQVRCLVFGVWCSVGRAADGSPRVRCHG
jgi:hypothetical protein